MKIVPQSVEMLWHTANPISFIASAARTCYKSNSNWGEIDSEFVRRLISMGHESAIEHASASFRIITDRGISHEIVRHRIASYSQESTRYCNYNTNKFGNEITVIDPFCYASNNTGAVDCTDYMLWKESCEYAEKAYMNLVQRNVPPQIARSVLPTCLKTELVMTANFREWRHFLNLRLSPEAHPGIREIAIMIHEDLINIARCVFEDLTGA